MINLRPFVLKLFLLKLVQCNFRDSSHVLLPAAVLRYIELGRKRGNSENLDFRDSCHVFLPEDVLTYVELGRKRGKYPKITSAKLVPGFLGCAPDSSTAYLYNRKYVWQRSSWTGHGCDSWDIPKRACHPRHW